MRFLRPLMAASAASALFASAGSAQLPAIAYTAHFQPQGNPVTTAFSGPGLFASTGGPNYASPGDALRRCYGVDSTNGGTNQSRGVWENTHFKFAQGYAANNTVQDVDIGIASVLYASDSDMGGDACFSPFFSSAGNTGGHGVAAAAIFGLQGLPAGFAFPTVWQIGFQWAGTGTGFAGVGASTTLGLDGTTSGGVPNPLLVNVIYEVQGPINGSATNNQYYLATTGESPGNGGGGAYGTGGVTNGNLNWGSSLFGVTADQSGAISHTRLYSLDPNGAGLIGQTLGLGSPGDVELGGHIAFNAPSMWGIKDGNSGAGANDWTASTAPVSIVDIRFNDHLAGATTNADMFAKAGYSGGGPAAGFDPLIVFNQSFFLWSCTSAATMAQAPMSWDDLGGALPAQPGGIILGPQATLREGAQTLPINFDACTGALLAVSGLSLGTPFTASEDIFVDGVIDPGTGSINSFWEGMFSTITSGVSSFSGGAIPIASSPTTSLAGLKVGIAGLGLQVSIATGSLGITEVGNGLTVNMQ